MISTDKYSGIFNVCCDTCQAKESFDTGRDWKMMLTESRESGWKFFKMGEKWYHKCSDCVTTPPPTAKKIIDPVSAAESSDNTEPAKLKKLEEKLLLVLDTGIQLANKLGDGQLSTYLQKEFSKRYSMLSFDDKNYIDKLFENLKKTEKDVANIQQ